MKHNISNTPLRRGLNGQAESLVQKLLRPKTLISLLLLWVFVVGLGSGLAITVTQAQLLSDEEVNALIRANEEARVQQPALHEGTPRVEAVPYVPVFPDRIVIDSIGLDFPVSNPQTRNIEALDAELKKAVVRYPDSAGLGQEKGNTLLFGHSSYLPVVRNKLYKAFNGIQNLQNGEIVKAIAGDEVYEYRVTRVYKASAEEDSIPLGVDKHRLTLLTCDSFGKKSDRFIVEAEFVGKSTTI